MPQPICRSRQSILVLEDDDATRGLLVNLLARLGYDSVPAATVAEGMARLDGQHRAILDINLPDGLGTRVLRHIHDAGLPIRVAVASGTTDASLLEEARRLKAELVLRKPVDVATLVAWLQPDDSYESEPRGSADLV